MIIVAIHDATQNYSMSVLYKQKIYSIELERLIGIKTGLYKNKIVDVFSEQYELGQHTYIQKDSLTLGDYGVYLMFKYFSDFLVFKKENIDLLVVSSGKKYINIFGNIKVVFPESHHLMHLYSTYFLSNYDESNILVIDGSGYNITENHVDLQSMYYGNGKNVKLVKSNFAEKDRNIGIGIAYDRVSVFLGLTEGKIMGLSGYLQEYTRYNFFDLSAGEVYLRKDLHITFCNREIFFDYFGLREEFLKNGYLCEKIINFIHSFQKEVEEAILYLANFLYEKNNCENLCYSGGVALNCLTNYRLKNELKYKNIFIQPASGDSGISMGNLLYGYYCYLNKEEKIELSNINYGLGIDYKNKLANILMAYEDYLDFKYIENDNELLEVIGEKIISKNVCIIFRGGSEFGPRALGNRSIITSVNIDNLQYKINKIKDREYWRPFGMMILKEEQEKYFKNSVESKYMLFTNMLNSDLVKIFENISHNDKSIRLQTITKDNIFYYNLLTSLNNIGLRGLLNTSLNGKGQPILETPNQALEFFLLKDGIDNLFLENYLISKKTNKKFVIKKLSNVTLIENVINNMKILVIKKTKFSIKNIFIDLDIYKKSIHINIIENNISLVNLYFLHENDKYILDEKKQKTDIDFSILINNILDNSDYLNKFFGVLRGVFMK